MFILYNSSEKKKHFDIFSVSLYEKTIAHNI